MPEEYSTAQEEHLPVPDNRLHWLVGGCFYKNAINDEVTYTYLESALRRHCGEGAFMTFLHHKRDHNYILFDPENEKARDIVDSAYDQLENYGTLDDGLYSEILSDRMMAEWDSASFSMRLGILMDADEDLSLQLAFQSSPPDDVVEQLEELVLENQ